MGYKTECLNANFTKEYESENIRLKLFAKGAVSP